MSRKVSELLGSKDRQLCYVELLGLEVCVNGKFAFCEIGFAGYCVVKEECVLVRTCC